MKNLCRTKDKSLGAPDVMRLDEETREDSSPVHPGYELLGVDATTKTFHELDAVLGGLTDTVIHTIAEITPHLASMQSLLSQRGEDRKKVLKLAGLPSWTAWAEEYGDKLNCTVRTIQSRIKSLRQPEQGKGSGEKYKPHRLDARQQRALVTAQVAANDLATALRNGGDWQTPLAEYERVALSPAKLDTYVNALNQVPAVDEVLLELLKRLQEHEDKLPKEIVAYMHSARQLLGGAPNQSLAITGQQAETTGMAPKIPIPAPNPQAPRRHENVVHPTKLPGDYEPYRATETSSGPQPTRDEAEPTTSTTPAFQPAAGADAPNRATQTVPSPRSQSKKPPKVTSGAPVTRADGEDRGNRVLPDATDYFPSVITQAGYAGTESGKWEFVGYPDYGE